MIGGRQGSRKKWA